jgi:hypothetical protein
MGFWRDGRGFTAVFDQTFAGDWPEVFFMLSLQREVDATLATLAAPGFTDDVRRITMAAPDGTTVPMAVITAPDGVFVELIGPSV